MYSLLDRCLILAQNAGGGNAGGGAAPYSMLLPLVLIGLVFYLLLLRPQRREQKARQEMLAKLKKNDRVVTVGGIYGVVTNVRPEADEVTIKVDETSNTRLKVTLSAISRVQGEEPSDAKTSS
jgi:preprotein translocase subunit YajC